MKRYICDIPSCNEDAVEEIRYLVNGWKGKEVLDVCKKHNKMITKYINSLKVREE